MLFPVFLLLCPQANAASPDALTENLYARAGGGVFFLDMSESSPFIRTNNREEVVGFLDHYDAAFRAGPLVNLAVGGEYDAFGKSLFTELSGFLTFYNSKHVNDYNEDSAPWTEALTQFDRQCPLSLVDGGCPLTSETEPLLVALLNDNPDARLVGWVGKIDGGEMPFGAPNFAWGHPIRISTKREVDFHGMDFVTGMFFRQTGRTKVSLFIGPSYKRLNQESETFAYESNRDPEVNNLTLKADLEAWYYGGSSAPASTFRSRSAGISRSTAGWGYISWIPNTTGPRERCCPRGPRSWTCRPIGKQAIRPSPQLSASKRR